ncbi:response regulator transcription factor [Clostridium mediterraneense]|uniref:response regulator transcription factor n=1 Tax=Clostridium mediterraneense TaxID=1805472 RepID=UPI00082A4F8C|nr:response regulator transcription factor [Clostridium mediterraneense]
MINVILIDDQQIIREGLKMLLSLDDDINIVAEGTDGSEALELIEKYSPDVLLMDIRMPIMNGVEATKLIKEKYPDIKILILTTFNDNDYIFDSLKNGANGYLLKDAGSDEIIDAIKNVYKGNLLIHANIANKLTQVLNNSNNNKVNQKEISIDLNILTPREKEVANLVAKGFNNKEICSTLYLSEGTVKNYVTRILDKLELKSRTELAILISK